MFCTRVAWVCLVSMLLCKEEGSSPVYEVPLSMSLLDYGIGTMVASFHMCGIMLLLRAV